MAGRILVMGATGKTGAPLVELLAEKGETVRAATRNASKAASRLGHFAEIVEFDLEQPQTFAPALAGVDRIFLIARPGDPRPHETAAQLIDAAKHNGVRHIVNLTAMGVEQLDDLPLRIVEKYLEASGIAWTHLRPNWFMQNFNSGSMLADIRATGVLHLPAADAKISFIDVRDISAVAAAALTDPRHVNKAYTLTGGVAINHYQVVSHLSEAAGRTIGYVALSEDDARKMLAGIGWHSMQVERMMNMFRIVRQGFCMRVSPEVESILGRAPIAFEQYAKDHAAFWKK